jgi:hypothetical protein
LIVLDNLDVLCPVYNVEHSQSIGYQNDISSSIIALHLSRLLMRYQEISRESHKKAYQEYVNCNNINISNNNNNNNKYINSSSSKNNHNHNSDDNNNIHTRNDNNIPSRNPNPATSSLQCPSSECVAATALTGTVFTLASCEASSGLNSILIASGL